MFDVENLGYNTIILTNWSISFYLIFFNSVLFLLQFVYDCVCY